MDKFFLVGNVIGWTDNHSQTCLVATTWNGDNMRTILSRRRLGFGALGATLVGSGTAVADDDRPDRRQLPWTFAPVPVTAAPGTYLHVFGGPEADNSTISNFKGSIGSALINGNVTRTNIKTGKQDYLPFINTNMRFMTGTFKGTDGQEHPGTFALV